MIRLIVYIIVSLIIAAGAAWLIGLPGTVTIDVGGYRLQPGLGAAGLALAVIIVLSILIWAVLRRLLDAPKTLARRARLRRRERGVEALSNGFIALEAGNPEKARRLAGEAEARLPGNPAARLLEARADLALDDFTAARERYKAMLSSPDTALAALSGLYRQARAQNRDDVAITFAQKAAGLAPGLAWAENAVFDDITAKGDWQKALEMAAAQPAADKDARTQKRRRQAVLNTALAAEREGTEPVAALGHAQAALKLLPDFVPAALIAGRIYASRGDTRKAQSLLRRVWRQTGHPHIAMLYANARPGASALERLKRVRELIGPAPEDPAAAMVLARAAIDAYEWPAARNALAGHAASEPGQGVCLLMAEIEEGQNADQGKAREWLARAVRAPRDPVWVADGITAEEWEPRSPVTGRLDAFEWKVPVSAVTASRTEQNDAPSPAALPATTGKQADEPI